MRTHFCKRLFGGRTHPSLLGLSADPFYLCVLIALLLSFTLDSSKLCDSESVCVVFSLLGIPCPGCGLVRSFVATSHFQFCEAFSHHVFGPLLFGATLVLVLVKPSHVRFDSWLAGLFRESSTIRLAVWALAIAWIPWSILRSIGTYLK